MKSMIIVGICLIITSCAGINALRVCSDRVCATGWYDENGYIVTAAHAFQVGEEIDVESPVGYTDRATIVQHADIDTALAIGEPYRSGRCYTDVKVGDYVTVSVWGGVARRRVTDVRAFGYVLAGKLLQGDSGAAVTHRGCVVGTYYGESEIGSIVVKTLKNKKYKRVRVL